MTRSPARAVLPLLASITLAGAGCGASGDAPLADLPALTATPELRIGSVDDPATALTWIREMVVDEAGRIYTAHPQESVVLVHDPEGRRVGELGGPGEGPGELRAVGAIGLRGDSLWVMDYRLYRVTWFGRDGAVLRSVRVPIDLGAAPGDSPPRPSGVLPDGRLYGAPPAWSRLVASGELTEQPVVVMDTTGAAGDTLFVRPLSVWAVQDPAKPNDFGSYQAQPFADDAVHTLSPAAPEYVVVDRAVRPEGPATFRVARVRLSGDTVFSREFPYDPVPIDPALPDSLIAAWAEGFRDHPFPGAPEPAEAAEWARADLYLPPHHPPVGAVVVGTDGTIWLERERVGEGARAWLVLDADGIPLGRVAFPAGFRLHAATRDRAWGVEHDELDVPYIVRYGIGPGGMEG